MLPVALTSTEATVGLVGTFFVLFPLLAHGLIGYAVAQALGEKAQNDQLKAGLIDDDQSERV